MIFTISPADAQAIQEDEAQLIAAIAQAARGVAVSLGDRLTTINQPALQDPYESLRIQMGRRLIYGQMARGEFRNELTGDSIKAIVDAIQRPVTTGIDPESYRNKVAAIEIKHGDTVLFREERDGAITTNQIQFRLEMEETHTSKGGEREEQGTEKGEAVAIANPAISQPNGYDTVNGIEKTKYTNAVNLEAAGWSAIDIAQAAESLLNPLGDEQPIYDSVSIGKYGITAANGQITITKDNVSILVFKDGEITADHTTQQDFEFFQHIHQRSSRFNTSSYSAIKELPHLQVLNRNSLNGTSFHEHPAGEENYQTVNGANSSRIQEVPPAIAVAQHQARQLPEGPTKQLLEHTTRNWGRQLLDRAQTGLRQGAGWLASRSEAWQHSQTARAALNLFNRGYARTGEHSYQVDEYAIHRVGDRRYVLNNADGELMQFQASKLSIPGIKHQGIQVISVSDRFSDFQSRKLQSLQRNPLVVPQGDRDIEANYAANVSKVEQTVILFLQNHVGASVWDRDGGRFKFERNGEESLRIIDKHSQRGVIFKRQNGKVFSRLEPGDFVHFERLKTKMQAIAQRLVFSKSQSKSQHTNVGLELD